MDHLHIRCPSCAKLYQVETGRIFSTSPEFQCVSCETRFAFEFPPTDPLAIQTYAILPREEAAKSLAKTRKCPRCAAESPEVSKECLACGVIFEKLEGLPQDRTLKAQPSLVRRWKEILADYTNEALHQSFLNACREQDALAYARVQYKDLKRLQGQDEIADRMLKQIDAISEVARAVASEPLAAPKALSRWEMLRRILLFVPYVVGFALVLWGASRMGQRNMIGAGIAVLLLSYGLLPEARQLALQFLKPKKKSS